MSLTSRVITTSICVIIAAAFLTACGDSPATFAPTTVNNVQPTSQPLTTQATPTVATTTSAATSQSVTTQAANFTDVAVTNSPSNKQSTAAAPVNSPASEAIAKSLPAISGAKDLVIDQNAITDLVKKLGIPGAATRLYVSDDLSMKLAKNTDTVLLNTGWKFAMPNATGPQRQNDKVVSLYTRPDQPDIYFAITDLPTDPKQLDKINLPGLSQTAAQGVASQLKGHRSLMILIVAPGMSQGASIGNQPKK